VTLEEACFVSWAIILKAYENKGPEHVDSGMDIDERKRAMLNYILFGFDY
jgi:hypothetical protein